MLLSCNTFAVRGDRMLEFFSSKVLYSRQRRALSRLHFCDISSDRPLLGLSTVATMTGLKHLQIFWETQRLPRDKNVEQSLTRFIQLRVVDVKVIVFERPVFFMQIPDMRTAREEAAGWEELLRTGETEYEFKLLSIIVELDSVTN